jgi:hypothetical protein
MKKGLAFISVFFLIFGIVLGSPLVVKAGVAQSLLIGVKQDPGGGFMNADLNDRYWISRLGIRNFESTPEAEIVYGYDDLDGAGSWDGQITIFSSDGSAGIIDAATFNGTYSVNGDGSFTSIYGTDPSTGHISIDVDRNFFIASEGFTDIHGIHQSIIAGVRAPAVPFISADLNGTWQFRDLEVRNIEDAGRDATACTATFVINNPDWNASYNCFDSDGTTNAGTVSGTYTLNGNTFNLTAPAEDVNFSAYLSRDKNTLILYTGESSGGEIKQYIGIALKATTGKTNADLSGQYFFHELFFNDFQTSNRSAEVNIGTVTFDGNGNWTSTSEGLDSDGSSGSHDGSGTYSVASNGSFTLIVTSDNENITLTGNLTGDNNIAILSEREATSDGGGGGSTGGGDGGGGGGCFIATAAYGSLMEPHVKILRDFRDKFLLNNSLGKGFVQAYYKYSPPIANFISKHDNLRAVVRASLLPAIGMSWIAMKIGPVLTVALMLFFISCFIGIVCFRRRYKE